MSNLSIVSQPDTLRQQIHTWQSQSLRVGFVPTMGYLHQGHLSLIEIALQHADRVVVSIFVNPTQFGPNEDLDQYPHDREGDKRKIEQAGAHLLFTPSTETIYPEGSQTFVEVQQVTQPLCGRYRPAHFRGVATVVTKLLNLTSPDIAVFGEKDFQQLVVIQQMVRDLWIPTQIIGGPIIREANGLAMSSRNAFLSVEQRQAAACLSRALREARRLFANGEREKQRLIQAVHNMIEQEKEARIQYIELREHNSLLEIHRAVRSQDRMFLAVFLGQTRLIDNAPLSGPCGL